MTLGFPTGRLGGALVASVAAHTLLAATLGELVRGWQDGSAAPMGPAPLMARLQPAAAPQPAQRKSPQARPARGPYDSAGPGVPMPAPYYYPAAQLTERPLALARIEPRFPEGAPQTGRLKMRIYINDGGAVDAIDILESEPAGAFEAAAAEAFATARFRPGHLDGKPVNSQLALEVLFGQPVASATAPLEPAARARPENPNAYDAPDRIGLKTRRPR